MDENNSTLELMLSYFVMAHNKSHTLKKLLQLKEWQTFCADARRAPAMFECFKKFFFFDRCHGGAVEIFLDTCGHHLAEWVIHDGPLDALALLLHHAHRARYKLWKERPSSRSRPDFHPLNQSLYCGRMKNVNLLLEYGYNLEFTSVLYDRLQKDVIQKLVTHKEHLQCLKKMRQLPNRDRVFLILLVIRIYLHEEQFPGIYRGCDEALASLWAHMPASYICKEEFMDVFDPFKFNTTRVERICKRYANAIGNTTGVYQPRTLAHHSRCMVRQSLGRNLAIPNGVNALPIPTELKNYLLYK